MPRDVVRLGLFQRVPVKWSLDENFEALRSALKSASDQRVELLITPECYLDGYAAADKTSTRDRLLGVAQEMGRSSYLEQVANEAKTRRMSILFGFTEKSSDKLFNAAGLWDADGLLTGLYHKTHLQNHDKQYDPGESIPVFESPWGTLGVMICADRRWPEVARVLRLKGSRLILCPSYGMHHQANEWWMRTRSYENDCFLAFTHPNVGFVSDPAGNIVSKLEDRDGGLLLVDLDLSQADGHRHLEDRRPELYGIIGESNNRL